MPTNQYIDLQAHEKLMKKMQEVVDKANLMLKTSRTTEDQINEHDLSNKSHQDIRRLIKNINLDTDDKTKQFIEEHNNDANAHHELFTEINNRLSDMSSTQDLIQTNLNDHNTSNTAHADIRESIRKINNQISNYNVSELNDSIEEIKKELGISGESSSTDTSVLSSIQELQNTDIAIAKQLETINTKYTELQTKDSNLERDVTYNGNREAAYEEASDKRHLHAFAAEMSAKLGYTSYIADGPSFVNFNCSIPIYIGRGTTRPLKFTGVTSTGGAITYSITDGPKHLTFSKVLNIADNEEITVTVPSDAEYGDCYYFTVTATDAAGKSLSQVVAFYITVPLNKDNLTMPGFPSSIEPGNTYKFKFRNLVESGNRFTYDIDPGVTGLIFSKQSGINENEEITMTVPEGISRDAIYNIKTTVHDVYSEATDVDIDISVDDLPSVAGFTSTFPSIVVPGKSYTGKFSGITSASGGIVVYSITPPEGDSLTFSKTRLINDSENITMEVNSTAVRGNSITVTVTAMTETGAKQEIPLTIKINSLPDSSQVNYTLVNETTGGITTDLQISGGTDIDDGSDITYQIENPDGLITFSKTKDILSNESISVTIPKVAENTTTTYKIYVVDNLGEKSEPVTGTMTIKPIYIGDTPKILYPTEGLTVQPDWTAIFSEYSSHVDV